MPIRFRSKSQRARWISSGVSNGNARGIAWVCIAWAILDTNTNTLRNFIYYIQIALSF